MTIFIHKNTCYTLSIAFVQLFNAIKAEAAPEETCLGLTGGVVF